MIGLDITEVQYREMDMLSYSLLSTLDKEGYRGLNKEFKSNRGIIYGILVEENLFGYYDPNKYHVMSGTAMPTGKLKSVCDFLFPRLISTKEKDPELSSYTEQLHHFLDYYDIDYYSNRDTESRIKSILAGASAYWTEFVNSTDKTVITKSMLQNAKEAVKTLETHDFTREIFSKNSFFDIEKFNQVKICFTFMNCRFKSMLDWVVVDHENKLILPYDLKTGKSFPEEFSSTFYYWRYDIQALLYTVAAKALRDEKYPGYTVSTFRFVYVSRNDVYRPLVWKVTPKILKGAYYGYEREGKHYKGVRDLVNEYRWYSEDDSRTYSEFVYKAGGELLISDNINVKDED